MQFEPYVEQVPQWPQSGRRILGHFDESSIVVYQAYHPRIGHHAVKHGKLGGDFSYSRMSWIKPNFLWMMFRSGWGTKENQEITLGLRIRRAFFDSLLAQAVSSSWDRERYATEEEWARDVAGSAVRVQWDPDHNPYGAKVERRAVQLGLRGDVLEAFGQRELLEVIDLSEHVLEQRKHIEARRMSSLVTPRERIYRPALPEVAARLWLEEE